MNDIMNERARQHRGPALVPVATVHLLLFLAGVLAVAVFAGGDHYPSPFAPENLIVRFFASHAVETRIGAFFSFGSAIPLGIFTATVASRLRFLGVRAAGESIALFGGIGAALALALSASCSWTLSWIGGSPDSTAAIRAVHLIAFATGGPATVVLLGLLVAGVAVTSGFARLLPRWLCWTGVGIGLVAELSSLVLVVPAAVPLLPIARFTGVLWLIAVGVWLPRSKPSTQGAP
jgi:hypothetical protein